MHRRHLLKGLLAAACAGTATGAAAAPRIAAPGLQLYTVRDVLKQDFRGTLARIAALGYRELDPDVFPELLSHPAYRGVERIAAVGAVIRRPA